MKLTNNLRESEAGERPLMNDEVDADGHLCLSACGSCPSAADFVFGSSMRLAAMAADSLLATAD